MGVSVTMEQGTGCRCLQGDCEDIGVNTRRSSSLTCDRIQSVLKGLEPSNTANISSFEDKFPYIVSTVSSKRGKVLVVENHIFDKMKSMGSAYYEIASTPMFWYAFKIGCSIAQGVEV